MSKHVSVPNRFLGRLKAGDRPEETEEISFVAGAGMTITPDSDAETLTFASSGGVPTSRAINTTAPLSGGGDLSADRTLTTSMATGKLIGRGSASTGVMEEITLGTGLALSGTTLNATATFGLSQILTVQVFS